MALRLWTHRSRAEMPLAWEMGILGMIEEEDSAWSREVKRGVVLVKLCRMRPQQYDRTRSRHIQDRPTELQFKSIPNTAQSYL